MKLKPLHDRVVVKPADAIEKTKSGILLPDSAQEKPTKGKVIAVGAGKTDKAGKTIPVAVKVGDEIWYGKYSGTEIEVDKQKLVILRESEILGV